jgi:hypothetical protein
MQSISTTSAHEVDAEIHLPQGVVAIEVELMPKSADRRRSIMAEVARRYATVWYFAPPNVQALLEETARSVPDVDRVRIYPLGQLE